MCSIPVWSMTLTSIFAPGSGGLRGMVLVGSICSHFSGSIARLKIALGFLKVLWFRFTYLALMSLALKDSVWSNACSRS